MNRIDQKFKNLKALGKKAFIAYTTAGYPDLKTTADLVLAFEKSGADIVEIGVPFSDPMADGPTIQVSSQYALQHKISLKDIFKTVEKIRTGSEIPLLFMTYYNSIFAYGEKNFVEESKKAGIDGFIVPDLPPEEAKTLIELCKKNNLVLIFFIAPTTTPARMKKNIQSSTGFVYYVSLTGVTGERAAVASSLKGKILAAKKVSDKPICVGFGISDAAQVKSVAQYADGVIVGSAIVKIITENMGKRDLVQIVSKFVEELCKPLK